MSRTPYTPIAEGSQATPGLWNAIFSAISTDLDVVLGTATSTFSSSVTVTGGVTLVGPLSVQSGPVRITTNSNVSDYLYFTDSSNQRSNYIIGSFNTKTADGLNIWDDSGQTMIASFSKQSIRFFQNVVGPVFDTGGALASTYNAATFIGSGSTLSGIQAAINAASNAGIARVYLPASMYPYDASKISFIATVQMIREGGNAAGWDVQAYGADPTQVLDSTAAMQGAHDSKQIVYYPPGAYSFRSNITMLGGGIAGEGQNRTYLVSTDTSTGNLFNCVAAQGVTYSFRDFQIQATSAKTAGTTFLIDPGAGIITDYLNVRNVNFQTLPTALGFVRADLWKVQYCNFIGCSVSGISINNATTFDAGDNTVSGCEFNSSLTIGDGITHIASNGLKIIGCKFNNMAFGYRAAWTAAGTFGNVNIEGCSFEGANTATIALTRAAGATSCVNVIIVGNQFGISPTYINADATGTFSEVVIAANLFAVLSNGTGVALNNVTDFAVTGNSFTGGARANTTGVSATTCTTGRIAQNVFYAMTTNQNVSLTGSTNVTVQQDFQNTFTDAGTIAIDMAQGSSFEGILNVAGATRSVGTPANPANGELLYLTFIQDGTGGRAVTWPSVYKVAWSDAGNVAGKRSSIVFQYDSGNWNQIGAQSPYV